MKPLSAPVKTHWAQVTTTVAKCSKATRRDGLVLGFTTHVRDLIIAGVRYSALPGIRPGAIRTGSAMEVDMMEVASTFEALGITEADILAGRWDYARVEYFEVNYRDLSMVNPLRTGYIGAISTMRSGFSTEALSLLQALQQQIGRIMSPYCDARVGDARCGVNLATFTDGIVAASVTGVTDRRVFAASALTQAAGWFDFGVLTWTSGLNDDLQAEVKTYTPGSVALHLPMPFAIQVGDSFSVEVGCDGLASTCTNKFANKTRFRGHEDIIGLDRLVTGK